MKKCLIIFAITASLFAKEVIDNVGNKVIVKDNIKRVLIARKPIVATFALFDGNIKKIVGVQKEVISFAKGSILEKKFPSILNLNTDFDTLDGINIEAVLKQNPDVILYPAEKKVIADRLMEAKLPMVGFDTKGYNYDNILIFEKWQELLGSLLNKNQNSKNIINYAKEVQNQDAIFKDLDLNKLTANFYKKYYNLNLNTKEIANIYKQK